MALNYRDGLDESHDIKKVSLNGMVSV